MLPATPPSHYTVALVVDILHALQPDEGRYAPLTRIQPPNYTVPPPSFHGILISPQSSPQSRQGCNSKKTFRDSILLIYPSPNFRAIGQHINDAQYTTTTGPANGKISPRPALCSVIGRPEQSFPSTDL
jgi:hypothetical protein